MEKIEEDKLIGMLDKRISEWHKKCYDNYLGEMSKNLSHEIDKDIIKKMSGNINIEDSDIKKTALYNKSYIVIRQILSENIEKLSEEIMPIFEPFIREHLNQYEEYRKLMVTATAPVTLVNNEALDKFKTLQHISGDLKHTLDDWGYTPNLYHFNGSWHVDWIHCDDGDSLKGFTAETAEEAIDKAYEWFHSKFCNG